MGTLLRRNALSLFFLTIFFATIVVQAIVGHREYNNEEVDLSRLTGDEPDTISLGRYVVSSSFARAVMENWQSEWLQFVVFLVVTVWLTQRGSSESKVPGEEGRESAQEQKVGEHAEPDSPLSAQTGGLRTFVFSRSLLLAFGALFALSWLAQSFTGWSEYNSNQLQFEDEKVSWLSYLGTADFWEQTLQNWQSEFLAVGTMVVFTIYLRQRGSPQSKPVGAPHPETATEG
jgi:hypothetical protein